MTFASFDVPHAAGFEVLAGRSQGLQRLMVVAGRLPASDVGIVHVHHGDEVLRVVSGSVELVEVHRADLPWSRPRPAGSAWTSDDELQAIYARLAYDV